MLQQKELTIALIISDLVIPCEHSEKESMTHIPWPHFPTGKRYAYHRQEVVCFSDGFVSSQLTFREQHAWRPSMLYLSPLPARRWVQQDFLIFLTVHPILGVAPGSWLHLTSGLNLAGSVTHVILLFVSCGIWITQGWKRLRDRRRDDFGGWLLFWLSQGRKGWEKWCWVSGRPVF